MKTKIICPKCKSKETIKWGKRKTENRGFIQRYCCKSCSETFVADAFSRMRNSQEKITCALDLFYRGLSTRDIQSHLFIFSSLLNLAKRNLNSFLLPKKGKSEEKSIFGLRQPDFPQGKSIDFPCPKNRKVFAVPRKARDSHLGEPCLFFAERESLKN